MRSTCRRRAHKRHSLVTDNSRRRLRVELESSLRLELLVLWEARKSRRNRRNGRYGVEGERASIRTNWQAFGTRGGRDSWQSQGAGRNQLRCTSRRMKGTCRRRGTLDRLGASCKKGERRHVSLKHPMRWVVEVSLGVFERLSSRSGVPTRLLAQSGLR
jgi:hypothetical protein